MISEDFDDVPPLEDMSHVVDIKKKVEQPKPLTAAQKPKEFSGLKKGFFSAPKTTKPKSTPKPIVVDEDIPFIKPQTTKSSLEFEEVRNAMASQIDQTRSGKMDSLEWMTPQFLDKIDKSPVLRKAFQDPRFLRMSQELVKDPVKTLQQCQQQFPEWMEALREFSGLLGEAFEAKANEVDTSGLDEFEKNLVNRVMKDQHVQVRQDSFRKHSRILKSKNYCWI
jgi:hypothetical protein